MANYTTKFRIRTSDLDEMDQVKPYAYLDFFQDIAGFHATELGFGYDVTIIRNIAWILMKNKVTIYKYPTPYDELTVKTYPSGKTKIDFIRDYEVTDSSGTLVARGTSQWCIVDTVSKKILRTKEIDFPDELAEPSFYQEKIEKIPFNDLNGYTEVFEYQIMPSDLDHYHHMNNARYGKIIFDAIDLKGSFVEELIVNYVSESKLNDKLSILIKEDNNDSVIEGVGLNENGQVSFSFRMNLIK